MDPGSPLNRASLVAVAEHHLQGKKLVETVKTLNKLGWSVGAIPAVETTTSQRPGKGHGGVWTMGRKHLHQRALTPDLKQSVQEPEHRGVHTQWTSRTIRMQSTDIEFCTVYLATGLGLEGSNYQTLLELGSFLKSRGSPFIVMGDWNNTVEELLPIGLHQFLEGRWLIPAGAPPGDHRVIDFCLVSSSLAAGAHLSFDASGPWAQPHSGLLLTLDLEVFTMNKVVIEKPLAIHPAMGPDLPWEYHVERVRELVRIGECKLEHAQRELQGVHECSDVDGMYMEFALTAESFIVGRQPDSDFQHASMHRGWPIQTKTVQVVPPRPEGYQQHPTGLSAWWALDSRLCEYLACCRKAKWHLLSDSWTRVLTHIGKVEALPRILPDKGARELCALSAIRQMGEGAGQHAQQSPFQTLRAILKDIERFLLQQGQKAYKLWIANSLRVGAGALHRFTKGWGEPRPGLAVVFDDAGRQVVEPQAFVEAKAQSWSLLWESEHGPTRLTAPWWQDLRDAADAAERAPISMADLKSVLKSFGPRVGVGADQQNPRWWASLPDQGIHALACVLEEVERSLQWPMATMCNVVALLPKTTVADRPITLTQALYRLWGRLRRFEVGNWSQTRAQHWDKVVKGSSPLRAALARQCKLEMASAQGFSWSEALWDISQFYDHCTWEQIAHVGRQVDYPVISLYMGLIMHASPRRVQADGAVSSLIWPGRSLMAGCSQAVELGKLALWTILEHVHAAFRPRDLSSWVDDLSNQEQGTEEQVFQASTRVSEGLCTALVKAGFKISSKSLLISNPPRLSVRIQRHLQQLGIPIQVAQAVKDLGVDGHAVRRRTGVLQGRMKKAANRAAMIRSVVKSERKARVLCRTGYKPQAVWGLEAQGLAPTVLRRLRAQVASMSGMKHPGGCSTTCIRLAFGLDADPFVFGRLQIFQEWIALIPELVEHQRPLELAWKKLLDGLRSAARPWNKVKGIISATIATLLDIRWDPKSPWEWIDGEGEVFSLRSTDTDRLLHFELRGALEQEAWAQASAFHHGDGLWQGADLTVLKRHIARLRRQGEHSQASVLQLAATGALWPASRRFGTESGRPPDEAPEEIQEDGPLGPGPSVRPAVEQRAGSPHDACATTLDDPEAVDLDLEWAEGDDLDFGLDDPWEILEEPAPQDRHTKDGKAVWSCKLCPRCGECEETLFHQLWQCPANDGLEGCHWEHRARAEAEHASLPCFWLRGLPPLAWTYRPAMAPTQGEVVYLGGSPTKPVVLGAGDIVATDGSGGSFSSEPRLRRCGWGFVVLTPGLAVRSCGWGPLHLWKQTVPLAELQAVQSALLATEGPITVAVDSVIVAKGIRRGPSFRHSFNQYRWRVFWECAANRQITVVKVRSHVPAATAVSKGYDPQLWLANELADKLADEAARRAQLPARNIQEVAAADKLTLEVQQHILTVAHSVCQASKELYGPSSVGDRGVEARGRQAARRSELASAIAQSMHRFSQQRFRCLDCHGAPGMGAEARLAFFRSPCPKLPLQVHPSHKVARHRGLLWCTVCGKTGSQRFESFRAECGAPTAHGRRVLDKLRAGRLPPGHKAWPDDEEGTGLELVHPDC